MPTEVDVVVVGGGPGGAAAAHLLAGHGRSVLVCERSHFPRDKACGDGVSPRGVRVLEEMGLGAELAAWEHVAGIRVHAGRRTREFTFPGDGPWPARGVIRRRRELDSAVLARAAAAGANVVHGADVKGLLTEGDRVSGALVEHQGNIEEVRARWVICAEGAGGALARSLGRKMAPGAIRTMAVRQYFPHRGTESGWFDVYAGTRLDGRTIPGYGWVFAVGDGTVNAGVGVVATLPGWRSVNLHRLQSAFLETLPPSSGIDPEAAVTPPRAGRVPMGAGVWPPHGPGYVLVGDAAAMVNPVSGEGIAYALETGRIAARHVEEGLRRGGPPELEGYSRELQETYGPYYRLGRGLVRMIGTPAVAETAVAASMASGALFEFAMTMMANLRDDRSTAVQRGFRLLEAAARLGA